MLQMGAGRMILVIHLIILVCVCKHAAGLTTTECEKTGNVYQKLEVAELLIKLAKENLSSNCPPPKPMDCEDLLKNGEKKSGTYSIWPKHRISSRSISVYCDMDTDGGGWTVIQRRGNFSNNKVYFTQGWQTYKKGFGDLKKEFWLGNDNIYALTNQKLYSIRFDLGDVEGNKKYAVYNTFWIEEEKYNYTLHVDGYTGDAGNSFSYQNGSMFATLDHDKKGGCTSMYRGGWWYKSCVQANLNGEYIPGVLEYKKRMEGLHWKDWKGLLESLATSEMKIRRNPSWVQ